MRHDGGCQDVPRGHRRSRPAVDQAAVTLDRRPVALRCRWDRGHGSCSLHPRGLRQSRSRAQVTQGASSNSFSAKSPRARPAASPEGRGTGGASAPSTLRRSRNNGQAKTRLTGRCRPAASPRQIQLAARKQVPACRRGLTCMSNRAGRQPQRRRKSSGNRRRAVPSTLEAGKRRSTEGRIRKRLRPGTRRTSDGQPIHLSPAGPARAEAANPIAPGKP